MYTVIYCNRKCIPISCNLALARSFYLGVIFNHIIQLPLQVCILLCVFNLDQAVIATLQRIDPLPCRTARRRHSCNQHLPNLYLTSSLEGWGHTVVLGCKPQSQKGFANATVILARFWCRVWDGLIIHLATCTCMHIYTSIVVYIEMCLH